MEGDNRDFEDKAIAIARIVVSGMIIVLGGFIVAVMIIGYLRG